MVINGNWTYCGDHFEMYRNIELLCCIVGINIVLQVSYTSETNTQLIQQKKRSDMRYQRWVWGKGKTGSRQSKDRNLQLADKYNYHSCLVTKSFLTLFLTLWSVAHQALLSMSFPRQEYWGRLPFPSPGNLSDPEIEPMSPALAGRSLPATWKAIEPPGKPIVIITLYYIQKLLRE